ncbi:MAG: RelA/SpoT family protein [Bacteroidia bacterium]|nr:RelA/SpoT family protein [Bacteroidia bacterium]
MKETATIIHSSEERKLIRNAYRRLLRSIKAPLNKEDAVNIRKAYDLAVEAHAKQKRKSGEPYILHPIEVARICVAEIGLGPTAIVCALLHDVVEDTEVGLEEIEDQFGIKIAKIVDGLTKLDGSNNADSAQAENFKKVLSTLVEDVRVVLIKMADRLHNMRTLGHVPPHKQLKVAAETSYIYAPLAHRLGLYQIKTEFEDLCMKITDSETYRKIEKKLKSSEKARKRYINEFMAPIVKGLDDTEIIFRFTGRPKSIYSISNKIKTKQVDFEEIYDLFAVRIIIDVPPKMEKPICWQVYSIITDYYQPIPERLKDWITVPKSNGYESLHTTVIGPKGRYVEVQIRSERMDEIAEKGFAAHWKYKGVQSSDDVYDDWLHGIREILEDQGADAIEFINDFKTNLFQEEVYVYTPKGDMKVMPKGATALDFAFSIHTDIGYHAKAIKVNNKLVPMGYKLENGDQLSVITSKNQKPNEGWIKWVITGKAKGKIRSAMNEERKKKGSLGKEALERKLRNLKLNFEENIDAFIRHFGYKVRVDLYYAIAQNEINLSDLKNFTIEKGKISFAEPDIEPKPTPSAPKRIRKKAVNGQSLLLINGESADQYDYSFATCCNPVQGDEVFAYLTATAGLKIHRTICPNAEHLAANYGYRIMKAEWASTSSREFVTELLISGIDDGPGVIERLSREVSDLGLDIRSFHIDGMQGYFEAKVSLLVNNKNQLNIAIRKLEQLSNVSRVKRNN